MPVPERAQADAAARGLEVDFIARAPDPDTERASGALVVKTIVVRHGEGFLFVLVPFTARFSWAKLRRLLGVNRIALPDADTAFVATGYRRGTITPLGAHTAWPVIADQRIAGHQIVLGSGSPDYGALATADDLIRAYGASTVDLAET